MADDGSGSDISIPSFLMFKVDADKVKNELMQNHPVQIEMSWKLPNPDSRVEYDLWTVPKDPSSVDFLTTFKPLAVALGKSAYFTPHQYIYDGVRSHCQGNDGENFCYNLCTNNGRYCATGACVEGQVETLGRLLQSSLTPSFNLCSIAMQTQTMTSRRASPEQMS
jgi:hypothetical protein